MPASWPRTRAACRLAEQETKSHMNLDDLFNRIEEGKQTDLNLIVKADVQGSIEALRDAFNKMDQSEVKINIVHSAVGGITETDVTLAAASDAIIIGFNVPDRQSKQQAEKEKVDIRLYRVIYQAIEDINAARVGLLKPEIVEGGHRHRRGPRDLQGPEGGHHRRLLYHRRRAASR